MCYKLWDLFNTGRNDLSAVHEAVISISGRLSTLAVRLGLSLNTVDETGKGCTTPSEHLLKTLSAWLERKDDTERHGLPSWRTLCAAVASEAGGGDKSLALTIAGQHPCGTEVPTGTVLYIHHMYSCFTEMYIV